MLPPSQLLTTLHWGHWGLSGPWHRLVPAPARASRSPCAPRCPPLLRRASLLPQPWAGADAAVGKSRSMRVLTHAESFAWSDRDRPRSEGWL